MRPRQYMKYLQVDSLFHCTLHYMCDTLTIKMRWKKVRTLATVRATAHRIENDGVCNRICNLKSYILCAAEGKLKQIIEHTVLLTYH